MPVQAAQCVLIAGNHFCPTIDLLSRHLATHDGSDKNGSKPRGAERALQACGNCIASKTKCSNQRPCQRCFSKGLICADNGPRRRGRGRSTRSPGYESSFQVEQNSSRDVSDSAAIDLDRPETDASNIGFERRPYDAPTNLPTLTGSPADDFTMSDVENLAGNAFVNLGQAEGANNPGHMADDNLMANFDFTNLQIPLDLFSILKDTEFEFDDTFQSLHSEPHMASASDDTSQARVMTGMHGETLGHSPRAQIESDSPHTRREGYEAFKRSPWLWTPANQDHAYAEGRELALDETQVLQSSTLPYTRQSSFRAPSITQVAARDEMLSMVLKFSTSSFKIRSFPSLSLLNSFMQAFFVRQNDSSDSWIHVGSFNPDAGKSEHLAGIVAAGSALFAVPNVWKMGLALQEIVKLSVCNAVDSDNRLIRNLQTNQTFLLWIELGLWSGFRRKMEIGEGFAHTLPTMLRRAGAFRQMFYSPTVIPTSNDDADTLREKWMKWVEQESFKRLVLRLLVNEMRSSIAFIRAPVLSSHEITFQLPAARDLWDSRDPDEWRARYLSKKKQSVSLTFLDAVHDASKLKEEKDIIDMSFTPMAILYALWARVWSFLDSRAFAATGTSTTSAGSGSLWAEAHRQELLKHIQTTVVKLKWLQALAPEGRLISELLMLSLHSFTDDIQRFAGRYGDDEVAQALPRLRHWMSSEDKNFALWHAGQVIKAARAFPPTQLGGFHAIAVYHACLCLWVFVIFNRNLSILSRQVSDSQSQMRGLTQTEDPSMGMHANNSLSAIRGTPSHPIEGADRHADNMPKVYLDGEDGDDVQLFLRTGYGRPFVHVDGQAEELCNPAMISSLLSNVFRSNFPSQSHPLPPLLEQLSGLVRDLGNLVYV
ncbi:hypothetical protein FOQG_16683 [Fusarium oxysporum f. sp. raphani 54005]|uniref:Zn(2)-C6 fungal-type domain-containing protein n=1 Tax=Fusarium oxysporum f. sp. raphani 54005 TaxID=1089458 RepID=X0C7F2_FUSOX|nr:hypothetical protein FOQG_16683 [Fusarium oxysporum f. sp. raphani 54005]